MVSDLNAYLIFLTQNLIAKKTKISYLQLFTMDTEVKINFLPEVTYKFWLNLINILWRLKVKSKGLINKWTFKYGDGFTQGVEGDERII